MNLFQKLWNDESGYILSAEAALLGTVGVVGATVGMGAVSKSINDELTDVAYSFRSLDQSYSIQGQSGCGAWTAGSGFVQQSVEEAHADLGVWIDDQYELSGEERPESARAVPAVPADADKKRREFDKRRKAAERNMKARDKSRRQSDQKGPQLQKPEEDKPAPKKKSKKGKQKQK